MLGMDFLESILHAVRLQWYDSKNRKFIGLNFKINSLKLMVTNLYHMNI